MTKPRPAPPVSRRQFLGQAGCKAMTSLPILNTLLNLRLAEGMANASAPAQGEYRALICLFFAGGNDSFNLLVPREPDAYATYQTSRANLALQYHANPSQSELVEIHPENTHTFAVHGGMPHLASLFDAGHAAFLANVGTLIEPVNNRTEVAASLKRLPLGLYSHSDQIEQWQTGVPHSRSGIGWGGRMCDLIQDLNSILSIPMQISLDGGNVWQTGNQVSEYAITPNGAVGLADYNFAWQQYQDLRNALSNAVDQQLSQPYSNLLAQTFNTRKKQAMDAYEIFAAATAPPLPAGVTFPNTYVGQRLAQVARTIQGRAAMGATRQTFFIQWGGWDHHSDVLLYQNDMLPQVSEALNAFHNAMIAIGNAQSDPSLKDKVCLFTASDFGRTLTSNGRGSDHAWGSNQLILGGGVQGKRIFGQYPDLAVNPDQGAEVNPLDTGRGRFIPTTSCDLFFAELALWLGVNKSDLPLVLPNIGNFYDINSSAPPIGMLL
jgi:uncharacterized protein (DUF1501 family)